jgi:hypothetical protein
MFWKKDLREKKYRDVTKKLGCKIETDFKRNIIIKKSKEDFKYKGNERN